MSSSTNSRVVTVTENNGISSSSNPTQPPVEGGNSTPKKRNNRRRNKKKNVVNGSEQSTAEGKPPQEEKQSVENNQKQPVNKKHPKANQGPARINKNRAQGRLTDTTQQEQPQQPNKKKPGRNNRKPSKLPPGEHDMATVLTHELKNSIYECMVCMDVVRPAHHVWTCDCCWAVFHLNCIQTWADKSLKEPASNKMVVGWRCPGCQNNRTTVPRDYLCFCGKQRNPEQSRYNTPHSCEQLCKRHKSCPHECVLPCHPGPCPPCSLMGPVVTCYCGHNTQQSRCVDTDYSTKGYSCEDTCDELLGCGKHRCDQNCHAGLCPPCELQEIQSCYCGRHERTARCGSGKQVQLRGHIGYYSCTEKCDTVFTCGQHRCEKSCHPCTANSQSCPWDPKTITTCPCGKHTVTDLLQGEKRASCTDPVPTCESVCNKVSLCGHPCERKCHTGDCPPCMVNVKVPCRCQATSFQKACASVCKATGGEPPVCERVCKSIRNCGKHLCGMECCPAMKVNGQRRINTEHFHDCPQVCDQLLTCGKHRCQDMCHKGKCRPCLEAAFDDIACNCGRTRLEPPVRCGTELPPCPHPCVRPNPCGHIRFLNHNCHPDDEPCPPCPALVTRHCLCGKTELKNVPCYRESPRCGRLCDKELEGCRHTCRKSCHDGACIGPGESCTQVCGGARSCGHVCQSKCHGLDTACPEVTPCTARIKASCRCGQITMEIPCNATAQSSGSKKDLDCNDFCAKVLRNRRLALAFDIKREEVISPNGEPTRSLSSDDLGYYDDSLRQFYLENATWCRHMENSLIEFVQNKETKYLHCKPMRTEFRRFIHRYAVHFNVATEAIDKEPKRSVIVRKTMGPTRVPTILLSRAARNPSLNCVPTTTEAIEADTSGRSASRQPVNALYLTDMAFGLTKLELDAELVPLIKIGNDIIHFTSKWVNDNDAIVVPSISDDISMDEKENIVWQLKKSVRAAFIQPQETKAARIDCCWVNQKGEVTWSEKQISEEKKNAAALVATPTKRRLFVNAFEALNNVNEDDGWMRVGGDNPYRPVKDAWVDPPKVVKEELQPKSSVNNDNDQTPESDDWEILLEENST